MGEKIITIITRNFIQMKTFTLEEIAPNDLTIFTNDGGVATIHYTGEYFTSTYYQNRDTSASSIAKIDWDEIYEGKSYYKDWDSSEEFITIKMIKDSLHWLGVIEPLSELKVRISNTEIAY